MKKTKILIPILGLSSVVGVVTPLITSCNMKESENVTISFYALEGGSISAKSIDAKVGDKWGDLKLPEATPAYEYVFMGWFNGNRAMRNSDIISSNMTITARFGYNPSRAYTEDELESMGFGGLLVDDEYGIASIPNNPTVVVPSRVNIDGKIYNVTTFGDYDFDSAENVQSIYFPKTITGVYAIPTKTLANIFVDPENPTLTSRSKAGVECNCVIEKEVQGAEPTPAVLFLGCANTIIPTDLNIKVIASNAFYEYAGETIALPDSIEEILENTFYGSSLKSITIPKKVKTIGEGAFSGCEKLEEVIMLGEKPTGADPILMSIGSYAFSDCELLKNVTWAKNIASFGSYAFSGCELLESVSIPACTNLIREKPFDGCINLSSIVVDSANEYFKSENSNCILQKRESRWILILGCKTTTVPAICSMIGVSAFEDCIGLTQITLPNSVTAIDDYAFSGCVNLESINIPTNLSYIGESAFSGCGKLTNVTLNNNLVAIRQYAFQGCNKLESIVLPESLEEMGSYAFSTCESLKTVNIKCEFISSYTFYGCTKLENVTFGDNFEEIGDAAFYGCSSLKEIKITKNIVYIGIEAFSQCYSLTSVTFDERTADLEIGNQAFVECTSLKNFTIPKTLKTVGEYVFSNCPITNKVIAFEGTNEEFIDLLANGDWDSQWNYHRYSSEEAVEKVECLAETDPSKKIIIIDEIR